LNIGVEIEENIKKLLIAAENCGEKDCSKYMEVEFVRKIVK